MSEKNMEIVRRYREAHNTGHLDLLNEIVSPNLITHAHMPGIPAGLAGGKAVTQSVMAACPDLHIETNELFAVGDKVTEIWTQSMTHTAGPFFGVPPTGKKVVVSGISVYRLENGKIVEHWGAMDFYGVLLQLGLAKPMG